MRRKLTTLAAKSGHNRNGNPRSLIDEAVHREHLNHVNVVANGGDNPQWDSQYSGWSNGGRSRDHAISLRAVTPLVDLG